MGLDIYFKRRVKSNANIERNFQKFIEEYNETSTLAELTELATELGIIDRIVFDERSLTDQGKTIKFVHFERTDDEEVGYARKHNFLLPFFGYEDDCTDLVLSKYQVEDFVEKAKEVLKNKDVNLAEELIPTTEGFFFGSTDYDEWYFDDLSDDLSMFSKLLEEFDWENDLLVMHCWW